MPPNSSVAVKPLLKASMRRGGPPVAGSTTPLALQRSEFEDFMNAYRPTLEMPPRQPEPPPKPVQESKVDFGRSIKKLIKRPQGSPSVQNKNHRKEGIQRTPTLAPSSSGPQERERSIGSDTRPVIEKKPKRPLSANIDPSSLPFQPPFGQIPIIQVPSDTALSKLEASSSSQSQPVTPVSKNPKTSVTTQQQSLQVAPVSKNPKASVGAQQQPSQSAAPAAKNPKTTVAAQQQSPPVTPVTKNAKASMKVPKSEVEERLKVPPESAPLQPSVSHVTPIPNPNQVKKKVSIQEDKRRSGTEVYSDAHCLIISGNNIGRFLPPRHNPDPILSMRVVPIPERKYNVILEFEESPEPPKMPTSTSGLMVITPDENPYSAREQMHIFSWIRESHIAAMGMLLENVEKITEFPFVTYLIVSGGRLELSQKLHCVEGKPTTPDLRQLQFLAGYEEAITITRPPLSTFPEKPTSDKTGFVISLYQVLSGEDGLRFEQNWVMWTGARQIYRTVPEYMGLKRISVHKSILPTKVINYCLICEFSNILDYLTEACVIIDHLRARCCGFTGIYRILDTI